MNAADVAMYHAKADGPGNYRFSSREKLSENAAWLRCGYSPLWETYLFNVGRPVLAAEVADQEPRLSGVFCSLRDERGPLWVRLQHLHQFVCRVLTLPPWAGSRPVPLVK